MNFAEYRGSSLKGKWLFFDTKLSDPESKYLKSLQLPNEATKIALRQTSTPEGTTPDKDPQCYWIHWTLQSILDGVPNFEGALPGVTEIYEVIRPSLPEGAKLRSICAEVRETLVGQADIRAFVFEVSLHKGTYLEMLVYRVEKSSKDVTTFTYDLGDA